MESTYNIGEIVWVKIKGYPWWPGIVSLTQKIIIAKINSKNYFQTFYLIDKKNI